MLLLMVLRSVLNRSSQFFLGVRSFGEYERQFGEARRHFVSVRHFEFLQGFYLARYVGLGRQSNIIRLSALVAPIGYER